jgi:hypothetical protein
MIDDTAKTDKKRNGILSLKPTWNAIKKALDGIKMLSD